MGIHTYTWRARRCRTGDASAIEFNRVEIDQARRGEAVPRGIACHVVQYVHSGSIHWYTHTVLPWLKVRSASFSQVLFDLWQTLNNCCASFELWTNQTLINRGWIANSPWYTVLSGVRDDHSLGGETPGRVISDKQGSVVRYHGCLTSYYHVWSRLYTSHRISSYWLGPWVRGVRPNGYLIFILVCSLLLYYQWDLADS